VPWVPPFYILLTRASYSPVGMGGPPIWVVEHVVTSSVVSRLEVVRTRLTSWHAVALANLRHETLNFSKH
jgi:hypothetical protein